MCTHRACVRGTHVATTRRRAPVPRVVHPRQAAGLGWDGPQTVPRVSAPAPHPARAPAQGPTCAA